MGTIAYRANLSAATYPMTIADGGRTVIIPGPDNNYDRRVDPQGEQRDAGIPQALYLENVMPTANGYQSVGYLRTGTRPMTVPVGATYIRQCWEVQAKVSFVGPYLYPSSIITIPLYIWQNGTKTAGIFGDNTVTVSGTDFTTCDFISSAVVRGVCYLYVSSEAVKELYTVTASISGNLTLTNVTASVTPLGFFTTNEIITVCSANNYLVAQSASTIFYSSTTTPTDFVSSLVSGAGQIDPNNVSTTILYIKETGQGFYIFATDNCIFAQYTGNARYPWKMVPVKNSTGVHSIRPWGSYGSFDSPGYYVIEKNRSIKFIQGAEAVGVAIEISDFLGKTTVQEVFDTTTNTFTAVTKTTETPTIYGFLNRYILVSVNGTNEAGGSTEVYDTVLVFDTLLARYGRLKIEHSFIFTVYEATSVLAFVNKQTKLIRYLSFDVHQTAIPFADIVWETITGVLVLGKFQYARSRKIQLEEIEIEGPQNSSIIPAPNFSCVLLPSLDGRTFDAPVIPYQKSLTNGLASYNCHTVGQNVSIALKGAFQVNTVQLKFQLRG